ncbi:MAG: hypothetical protein ACYC57_02405 [Thermoleophilia bacterium]
MAKEKTPKREEPRRLQNGKTIHKSVQEDWVQTAEGHKVKPEKQITKPSGRQGRIDIHVITKVDNLVAVVEIKASDWDAMKDEAAVRRNVNRQVKQIWDYIESQLEKGLDVSPGVIFPERPRDAERKKLIEELFDEQGVPVVWEDETIEERKERA